MGSVYSIYCQKVDEIIGRLTKMERYSKDWIVIFLLFILLVILLLYL